MKKQIIITKLFDSGGSNSHFKTLIKYWGEENILLILEANSQTAYLKSVSAERVQTKIISSLHSYAHLSYKWTTNLKESWLIIKSLVKLFFLSVVNGFAGITISSVEPERHLYLFWLPFIRVTYIQHSQPSPKFTFFTSITCNLRLGNKKKIIAVSEAMKQLTCYNWEIKHAKSKYVYNVPNCMLLPHQPIVEAMPIIQFKRIVMTTGHVDTRKNPLLWLDVAIRVTNQYPDVGFIWVGNGPDLIQFQNITNGLQNIIFIGHKDNPHPYLAAASIYYQPSLVEPHGIAVIEAMYHGLPCVVSNVGGLPESVQHEENGLVVPAENINAHVDAIIKLLQSSELSAAYGTQSHKRFNAHFGYNTFKARMDKIYYPVS